MLILSWVAAIAPAWFFCLAAPRFDSRVRGALGFVAGSALLALATAALVWQGLGLGEALACALGLLMLAVPCVSWFHAARTKRLKA
ncbi:hypothetical protein [Diaphorobacter aerolatus]|uniref:Uncharacterized protein n=1 Tax=Diaphorobacter aerolatus TaxID=1288495 RepID=A0A7H0GHZ6_9BURK|nr:hypothetical protein [Diaphorobacter aerolatus]QNP47912.1 hypothetical protein H9K75_17575 [Diaphorobacter aerolatus]